MKEMPMNIEELRAALDKLSNELSHADHSISNRCKDNASVTIGDLHFLNELDNLESHLDCLLREGAQLKYDITHGYCQWITRHRKVLLPDELDNKTIYSLYLYTQRAAGVGINAQNLEPASEITYAIDALCDLTPPLCHERDICKIPTSIEFKDGTKLLFHRFKLLFNRFNVSGGLEDATSSDDVAGFCLGMDRHCHNKSKQSKNRNRQNKYPCFFHLYIPSDKSFIFLNILYSIPTFFSIEYEIKYKDFIW